jgi:hypothetical protein
LIRLDASNVTTYSTTLYAKCFRQIRLKHLLYHLDNQPLPFDARNRPPGRRWRRRNYSFQHRVSRREGAVPVRDDGVCLTTLRDRRAGPVKGGVRRQAPSRLREPLKAVMEPAPPPSRPDSGQYPF